MKKLFSIIFTLAVFLSTACATGNGTESASSSPTSSKSKGGETLEKTYNVKITAGSLVILYKQNGEVFEQQPIGHTDDDVSFFNGMGTTEIKFERE